MTAPEELVERIITDVIYIGEQARFVMDIPDKTDKEGMLEYAQRLSDYYAGIYELEIRKPKGQFFTPQSIADYMADFFDIQSNKISLLDPGAGTGSLTAAFCEKILRTNKTLDVSIDLYENDPEVLPYLKKVLESCKATLENNGHKINYVIYEQDFIIQNGSNFSEVRPAQNKNKRQYDYIISNPPYYKLNKDSPESIVMDDLVSGQPNIYSFFMASSAKMLKPEGEMVFITPRSFCSGLYYSKFRKWLLNHIQITNIHIFESRKEVFDQDDILQESIIIKGKKTLSPKEKIEITVTKNKDLTKLRKIIIEKDTLIYRKNGDVFIRIPTSSLDQSIIKQIDSWPNTIKDLGIRISTGPVVPFRAKEYLLHTPTADSNSVPLLWMHNMKDMEVIWPMQKNGKEQAIMDCKETKALLLPVKNYPLLKRFTSKEQKRRLYASVMLADKIPFDKIGIENHVNYIYNKNKDMTLDESFGITAILNTAIVDNYFRSLNGNTQVNATDIRSMPFPSNEKIIEIGRLVNKQKLYSPGQELDQVVAKALDINGDTVKELYEGG